ncbi:MAG: hypothetical protein OXH79_19480 [Boseongicola sp.]|nr:hypothetical protein [Boseongicola sp.]
MGTQTIDPIIAEVRAVRDAHAARFAYDVAAIFRDIREMQKASGRNCVRHPAWRSAPPLLRATCAMPEWIQVPQVPLRDDGA